MIPAVITGVGGYVPENILSNKDLEQMVDTNDEWIRSRTGIVERRILKEPGWGLSDMCAVAVNELLEKTNTKAEEIDMLICGTITADYVFPDSANTICDKVGATNAFGYDINAACSGFLFALATGAQFVRTGMYKKVVVVGGDVMSSIIDYTDRATCIIFGDGCGAVMLEPGEAGFGYVDAIMKGDGSGRSYLYMEAGGSKKPTTAETVQERAHFVYQDGKPVFKAAVKEMANCVEEIMKKNDLKNEDLNWLVPHQANQRILSSVAGFLDLPMDRVMQNIEKYGNTTSGTLPLCLWDYEKQLKRGDKIVFTAFGGGFTWGALYFIWAYDS
jgi:3-oxoacyl-[acyl-carrier-protein] synthase-3